MFAKMIYNIDIIILSCFLDSVTSDYLDLTSVAQVISLSKRQTKHQI